MKLKYLLLSLLFAGTAQAATTPTVTAVNTEQFNSFQNILKNSGFEPALGTSFWTASGGATTTTTTTAANVGRGSAAYDWDSNAANQTLTSSNITLPAGLYGRNMEVSCLFKCASGTCTHTISAYDGTNVVGTAQTITSTSTYSRTTTTFIAPSSGTLALQIKAIASNEPELFIDDCYLGENRSVATTSQAVFVGSAYIPTTGSCSWSRTNTALGSFSTTAACPGPTVDLNPGPGVIQTTDTDLPKFTVNNLPPGYYRVVITASVAGGTSTAYSSLAISDGTTTSNQISAFRSAGSSNDWNPTSVEAFFNYTTAGNRTFELFGAATSGTVNIENLTGNEQVLFSIFKFPSTPEQAYRPDLAPASWSGSQTVSGGCATSSSTFADVSACTSIALTEITNRNFGTVTTAGSSLPGITFTPRVGRYLVCASVTASASTGGASDTFRLTDGTTNFVPSASMQEPTGSGHMGSTTLCGIYNATSATSTTIKVQASTATGGTVTIANGSASGSAALTWSLAFLDQSFPAPVLVGSVTSTSTGSEHIERALVAFGSNCTSTPCTISSQSGSWLTSVTRNATGDYTFNIATGEFSAAPSCTINSSSGAGSGLNADPTSTAVRQLFSADTRNIMITCMGPR